MDHLDTMAWSDKFLLGYAPMDDTHREFVSCVQAMQTAADAELAASLDAMLAHAVAHFEQEREWMQSTGFPATQCHIDEHEAVLKSLHEVKDMLSQGDHFKVVRDLAQALQGWFPGHADYMDAALSHWMSKRTYGGAPVVIRRGVANADTDDTTNNTTAVR